MKIFMIRLMTFSSILAFSCCTVSFANDFQASNDRYCTGNDYEANCIENGKIIATYNCGLPEDPILFCWALRKCRKNCIGN
jgi:hypothetical protein